MKATSKVQINHRKIAELTAAAAISLEVTAELLHEEVDQAQVVPRKDGALSGESFFVDTSESRSGSVSLVHSEIYARRLYYHPEYNFKTGPWEDKKGKHDGNPNAKGKWFEDWLPGGKNEAFCAKAFKELYRRNAGL